MTESLIFVATVIQHTPVWAWMILLALVVLGVRRLGRRRMTLRSASIAPSVFLIWSLVVMAIFAIDGGGWAAPLLWVVFVAVGFSSFLIAGPAPAVWTDARWIEARGSVAPLLIYTGVFLYRYGLSVWVAFAPDRSWIAHALGLVVSGFMAGRTAGDLVHLIRTRPSQRIVAAAEGR